MRSLQRTRLAIGGALSVILGLLLAAIVFVTVVNTGGSPTEDSSYCSKYGLGSLESAPAAKGKDVVYVEGEWSGFPPTRRCRAFALERTGSGQPAPAEEMLAAAPPPHLLLADGTYPGSAEYAWILAALLAPPAIWALLAAADAKRRRSA